MCLRIGFVVFLSCCALVSAGLQIITRQQWHARNATLTTPGVRPVPYVVIHHSAGTSCFNPSECEATCRSIQDYHMDSKHWWDIGYNFLIGEDGRAYEGRGWKNEGAQVKGWNNVSIGICFMGLFTASLPTRSALRTAEELIRYGVRLGQIETDYKLIGHRQARINCTTECPGQALYEEIQRWPHWVPHPQTCQIIS